MLTRNVSLIEGLLNDEKKLLQFLDGKYQQYKEYSDCTLDVRYVGNKPYYSFHRAAEKSLYLGSPDNAFVQNIQNCRTCRDLSVICRDNVQTIEQLLSQYTPITPNNLEELLPNRWASISAKRHLQIKRLQGTGILPRLQSVLLLRKPGRQHRHGESHKRNFANLRESAHRADPAPWNRRDGLS